MTITSTDKLSARSYTGSHTLTFFHAELALSRPVPASESSDGKDGWWTDERFHCTHHHETPATADECGSRALTCVRRTGFAPRGWIS